MRYRDIINEQSLADVGVRGGKFYLALRGEQIDYDKLLSTGKLDGIKGISSSKDIWADFGPNMGRSVLFVMQAKDVLRANKVHRIAYDSVDDLVANNSFKIGRILSIKDVARAGGDNLILGCFPKQPQFRSSDPISVINNSITIADRLRRGENPADRFTNVDPSIFDLTVGLRLNSVDDYAKIYHQGAIAAGWYGKEYVKFFSPQNRREWYPAIAAAIMRQANVYADESEWIVDSPEFTVPASTYVIIAVPANYAGERPSEEERAKHISSWWSSFDEERYVEYQATIAAFKKSRYKFSVVESGKTSNSLLKAQTRRRHS